MTILGYDLLFPSGERYDLATMPRVSSGRTTLADGSEGEVLQPSYREVPPAPAGMSRITEAQLKKLAEDLGGLLDAERCTDLDEPWFAWAVAVERQALGELARRAL